MNSAAPVKCAIWARVSTEEQDTSSQLNVLRGWAEGRGFEVVREFITEDSAWTRGNGTKGRLFDQTRAEMLKGARRGEYHRVLIWSLDRLSRRGIKDTTGIMEDLDDVGVILCSYQQDWLETSDPRMRNLVASVMSWLAEVESHNKSMAIRRGIEKRRRDLAEGREVRGKQSLGGRKKGAKDRRPRNSAAYRDAWAPGGALRVARDAQLAAKRAAEAEGSGEEQAG